MGELVHACRIDGFISDRSLLVCIAEPDRVLFLVSGGCLFVCVSLTVAVRRAKRPASDDQSRVYCHRTRIVVVDRRTQKRSREGRSTHFEYVSVNAFPFSFPSCSVFLAFLVSSVLTLFNVCF